MTDVTLHCMIRDEAPGCYYALQSVLPYVDRAIVVDTGSTDRTVELIERASRGYKDRVDFRQETLPDSSPWVAGRYAPPNPHLTEIRNRMIEQTRTRYIWLLDGDEVYREITARQCLGIFQDWPGRKRCCYIPLLWFGKDIYTLALTHPPTYDVTGRLFRAAGLTVRGAFPGEMHAFGSHVLTPDSALSFTRRDVEPFHHYELTRKPWRRQTLQEYSYDGPQPEVFQLEREEACVSV